MSRSMLVVLVALFAVGPVTTARAVNANLNITDVRAWGSWDAQITSASWKVTVDGIVARSEMTLSFKDTISTASSDSLELFFRFNLPAAAVVDSLYLWIAGQPVPGLLLQREYATQIYETIVRRRRDPALLVKPSYAPTYELRIFPFRRRETRTVKICYYLPLGESDGQLRSQVPVLITAPSLYPVGAISAVTTHIRTAPSAVQIALPRGFSLSQWQYADSNTMVSATATNARPDADLATLVGGSQYSSQGLAFQFASVGGTQWAFLGLVNPGRLVGYTGGTGTFYPANLSINGAGEGFVFDLFGLQGATYATNLMLMVAGMVRGEDSLAVAFNGVAGSSDYVYRGTVAADRTRSTDRGVTAYWASKKVESFGMPSTYNASLNLVPALNSMLYGILTPYTALLAIEPNMELGFANDQGSNSPVGVADVHSLLRTGTVAMAVSVQPGTVSFAVDGLTGGEAVSLRIYDMTGRLVVDLSAELAAGRRTVSWRTAGMPVGAYVARLTVNGKTLTRQFSTVR